MAKGNSLGIVKRIKIGQSAAKLLEKEEGSTTIITSSHIQKIKRKKILIMEEEWKDVKGFEGLYQISNYGRIKSLRFNKVRLMKPFIKSYYMVELCVNSVRKTFMVHRLVAEAFIPNPENKPQVNHIDGNKLNPRVDNLEWCTPSENLKHAYRTGLAKPRPTFQNQPNQKAIIDIINNKEYFSIRETCRQLKIKKDKRN